MLVLPLLISLLLAGCGGATSDERVDEGAERADAGGGDTCTIGESTGHPHGCDFECLGTSATCFVANSAPFICNCDDVSDSFRTDTCPPSQKQLLATCR